MAQNDYIVNDRERPDFSSQARLSLTMNRNKLGKQVPASKLKDNIGAIVTRVGKKLGVQSSSIESAIRRKHLEMDDSKRVLSSKDHVNKFGDNPRTTNCARMGPTPSSGLEIAEHPKPIQREVEAAQVLMQLSNDVSGLCKSKMQSSSSKGACLVQGKQKRRKVSNDSSSLLLDFMNHNVVEEYNLNERYGKFGTKGSSSSKMKKASVSTCLGNQDEFDHHCTKTEEVLEDDELPISSLKRKELPKPLENCGLKKAKAEPGSFEGSTTYSSFSAAEIGNSLVTEQKPFKLQFNSPAAPMGFSFSIIQFLSAIRIAMITPNAEDAINPKSIKSYHSRKRTSNAQGGKYNLPCLTMHEIIERVRLNPGDPCILEAQEPLQDLVRSALNIFSSTVAPHGAKAWKPLTLYSKTNKSWSWIGPVATKSHNHMKEAVSSKAWGLPLNGRKSTVAPLRRCSGKPLVKCRDHFMLKADRPPDVTVLSLVRDAAARLPDGMGTRADVGVLLRDSQYIVEDISEEQLNQVVKGALDRLHSEYDPCVQFNGDRKLWFYLHGDREENDLEYDATLSIRRRRRQ
ncbi:Nuclear factor related to kappa-B-binding protein [Corchorus capsularis]|uniref:Nuclear factor related to kappa-B-binding protein n=1 Tax=Corchorus capsularis TaxID=210143 RepID=A0A1R3HQQ8_COCAP|nr:Nuclear factor related to kappa-B-binding protein [Corchorus capsularis]